MTAKSFLFTGAAVAALLLSACDQVRVPGDGEEAANPAVEIAEADVAALAENPLLQGWTTPYGVPPFAEINDDHYMPAIDAGIAELQGEIAAIIDNPEAPSFENTIVALDKAGGEMTKVLNVFGNITNTDTNDTLSALEAEVYPKVTKVGDDILFNEALFARVKAVYDQRETLDLLSLIHI